MHPAGATTLILQLLFTPQHTTPLTELEKQGECCGVSYFSCSNVFQSLNGCPSLGRVLEH